jgi:fatty acid desaturase
MTTRGKPKSALVSLRSFVIIVVAAIVGMAAGALTYWSAPSVPACLLVGATAFGASLKLLHELIE